MNRILELLIDDFQNVKPSAEYQLVLQKVRAAEAEFMASLDKNKKPSI